MTQVQRSETAAEERRKMVNREMQDCDPAVRY